MNRKGTCAVFAHPIEQIFPNPPSGLVPEDLLEASIPSHVGVIMDGNGRWAKKRALNRLKGHKAGIEAVRETIRAASDVGVRFLSLYSFSTENWSRPQSEVAGLMDLFAQTMLAEIDGLHEENVRVIAIGDLSILPEATREAFERARIKTSNNTGLTLYVAVNYGGRSEIVRACNQALQEHTSCLSSDEEVLLYELTEQDIARHLYTSDADNLDLIIRTSGEMRLSNFMLWQAAYSEFYSTETLWPDFDRYEFLRALLYFQKRHRRFGAL